MNQLILVGAMAGAAILGGLGQIMMKKASGVPIMQAVPYLLAFGALYGIGVVINYFAYRFGGKVSILYPVISISYIAAAFFAWKMLGEPVSGWSLTGIGCIMLGVSLIGWGAAA